MPLLLRWALRREQLGTDRKRVPATERETAALAFSSALCSQKPTECVPGKLPLDGMRGTILT